MMDSASCRVLIDAVYEPHYAHYGEEFGKTIAGFFSDEPELETAIYMRRMWYSEKTWISPGALLLRML